MDEKLIYDCSMKTYNYVIEPGDGTLYRFFYGVVPLGAQKMEREGAVIPDSYIILSEHILQQTQNLTIFQ